MTENQETHQSPGQQAGFPVAKLFAVVLVAVFVGTYAANALSGMTGITGQVAGKPSAAVPSPSPELPSNGNNNIVTVSLAEGELLGDDSAPVTIVEYSDFQCPYCAKAETDAIAGIKQDYIDTGKARLVYKHFPLSFHPQAQKAAEASECAKDQGKFWEMHGKIYANQALLSDEIYATWAQELGLDATAFSTCLDSGAKTAVVNQEFDEGTADGVSGTPTFFINGKKLVGAQPYAAFKAAIDAELAA